VSDPIRELAFDARLRDEMVSRGWAEPAWFDAAGIPSPADLQVLPEDAVLRLVGRRVASGGS
jgi:hypothetical protein